MSRAPTIENTSPTRIQRFLSGFNQAMPVAALVYAIFLTLGGYWLYTRDAQTVQAQAIKDLQNGQAGIEKTMNERTAKRDQQLDSLEKKVLTRELYEAYHKGDIERMDRIEKLLERLLER